MKSIYKQSLGYFRKNKLNVLVLCLLTFLTSFLYFFVESSIDSNLTWLSTETTLSSEQKELLVGLNSNQVLANGCLFILLLLTCFVFFMFYKKNFELERKNLAIYRSLGFTKNQLTVVYLVITAVLSTVCLLVGTIVGYYYSYILLKNYQIAYHISTVTRGLSFSSFIIGIIIPICLLCFMTYLASKTYRSAEISTLFTKKSKRSRTLKNGSLLEKVAKFLPAKYSFSSKLALRNPFSLILIFISVYIYLFLVVLSISLNLSSSKLYESQTMARNYNYEVTFSKLSHETTSKEFQYFIKQQASIGVHGTKIGNQTLIALDNNGKYFQLVSKGKNIQLKNNEVAINPRLAELYGLKIGNKLLVQTKNFKKTLRIKAVADNGNINSIYLARSYFTQLIGQTSSTYNGLWSNKLNATLLTGKVETYKQYQQELQNNNVSNRTSAVINQVLAVVFGGLLIFLVLLLNFQDNTDNFMYLRKLGYLRKEVKNMLINIYLPLIVIAFMVAIIPSIWTSKYILRLLSLQTGDYMPFITNTYVFIYASIGLVLIYSVVLRIFDIKLSRIFKKNDLGERI